MGRPDYNELAPYEIIVSGDPQRIRRTTRSIIRRLEEGTTYNCGGVYESRAYDSMNEHLGAIRQLRVQAADIDVSLPRTMDRDPPNPCGGVRHVIPGKANYLQEPKSTVGENRPEPSASNLQISTGHPNSPLWDQLSWRIAGARTVDILASIPRVASRIVSVA